MDNAIKELTYKGYTIKILPDDSPESPREWDNLGIMVCFHKRYDLGDKVTLPFDVSELGGWDEVRAELEKMGAVVILPIYMYDHSGIALSVTADHYPFNDRWDAGQVGFIYTTKEQVKKMGLEDTTEDELKKQLKGEIETYETYINGFVTGFVIEKPEKCEKCGHIEDEVKDSCWGFYDPEEAEAEAKSIIDSY